MDRLSLYVILILTFVSFISISIFMHNEIAETTKCIREVGENLCEEKGAILFNVNLPKTIYDKYYSFECAYGVNLTGERFLFLEEDLEDCLV